MTLDFLGVERSFQELDKTGCSCRDQIHRYGITACSNVTAAEVCCDDPLISRRVLHTTEPVTVIISDGLQLNAARAESALADVVHVRHVDQQAHRHLQARTSADHQHGIADPNLRMESARSDFSSLRLFGIEHTLQEIDQLRSRRHQVRSDRPESRTQDTRFCRHSCLFFSTQL